MKKWFIFLFVLGETLIISMCLLVPIPGESIPALTLITTEKKIWCYLFLILSIFYIFILYTIYQRFGKIKTSKKSK